MSTYKGEEYKFPDEMDASEELEVEIEIEDDTPEQDRGKTPSDPKFVEELDKDELDEYSTAAKQKIAAFKKVYHDERRAKESADREREEAVAVAKKLFEENKALKGRVNNTEGFAINSIKSNAQAALDKAKREYRDAYESGDTDKIIEAQEAMTEAKMSISQAETAEHNFKNRPVQEEEFVVQTPQRPKQPPRDQKFEKWRERNSWIDSDSEMRALAMGIHEKLVSEHGAGYATTDEYYRRIDATVRKRFPEKFEDGDETEIEVDSRPPARTKPSVVVAPASRSTASKKMKLKPSQVDLARKLGITNEQYAKEVLLLGDLK
jgi:hypothetical protein